MMGTQAMGTIKVTIGSIQSSASGTARLDTTREVEFEGERLAEYHEAGIGRDGNPTDTRGVVETLYKTSDGRLIVHVHEWSHWQGEPTTGQLFEVTETDLSGAGDFADLGREAGYGRPLTIDEALTPRERFEYDEPDPAPPVYVDVHVREPDPAPPVYVDVHVREPDPAPPVYVDVHAREPDPATNSGHEVQEGEHVLEINVMVYGEDDALGAIEEAICDALDVGGLHARVEKLLVDFAKAQGCGDITGQLRVYNINPEWEHYDPEHDNTAPQRGQPSDGQPSDGQHCEQCGKLLPASASPYQAGGNPVFLCPSCAIGDD